MLAIADDELRARLRPLLDPLYLVEEASDGRVAIASIRAFLPDIVVADADLPELDGFGLLHELRSDAVLQSIPLILLTARASGEFAIDALEAVADDYLEKPFPFRELLARVRTHLEFARSRKAWAAEIARAQEETERIQRAHRVFYEAATRDLRIPLRTIEGFARGVLERHGGSLDARGNRHLERIHAGARQMGQILTDLTELARIAELVVHPEPVVLADVARRVFGDYLLRSPERSATIETAPDLTVRGDRRLLTRLFQILIDNAWKSTATRESTRLVLGRAHHAGRDAFFLADNGVGFDPAHVDRVFLPYQRLHAGDDVIDGGIGLAIARQLVELHHGEIWASSELGRGATFYFTLGGDS